MEKDKSDELSRAVKISNMPVGLLEQDIRMILSAVENIERIIMGKTSAIVIFDKADEDTISLAYAYNGYEWEYEDEEYILKVVKAEDFFVDNDEEEGKEEEVKENKIEVENSPKIKESKEVTGNI
jgi:hypothetical protein